jgi:hypothetical protein
VVDDDGLSRDLDQLHDEQAKTDDVRIETCAQIAGRPRAEEIGDCSESQMERAQKPGERSL